MLLNIFRNYLYNRIESSLIESTLIKFADTILSGEKNKSEGYLTARPGQAGWVPLQEQYEV